MLRSCDVRRTPRLASDEFLGRLEQPNLQSLRDGMQGEGLLLLQGQLLGASTHRRLRTVMQVPRREFRQVLALAVMARHPTNRRTSARYF